ncbi:MAG: ribokinase [Bryobacterales bacterium]|nr:ribokinase [Bryobacterales bacterium]
MTVGELTAALSGLSALVVGDICLDRWCTYSPAASEPSRETGIPRIGVLATEATPGGGGTVACNLAALGVGRVSVLGISGDDGHGFELLRALRTRGVGTDLMVTGAPVPTFTYTKIINSETGIEDRPRLDFISMEAPPAAAEQEVLARLESAAARFDVIFVSDQAETSQGVITPAVRELLAHLAGRYSRKPIWVDSRKHIGDFRKVIIKPNREEADAECLLLFGQVDYQRLRQHAEAPLMVVTLGPAGALLVENGRMTPVRTTPVDHPVDICGAGDSFSAGAGLALAAGASPVLAARFGNLVASITIMKKGTGAASAAEVLAAGGGALDG